MNLQAIIAVVTRNAGLGERLGEGLGMMAVGMVIVFLALVVIGSLIWLTRRLLHGEGLWTQEEAVESPSLAPPPPVVVADSEELSPELVAVLAAAAVAALRQPVRIVRVRFLQPQDIQGWVYSSRAGSHRQPAYRKGRT